MRRILGASAICSLMVFLTSCGFTVRPSVLLNVDDSFLYSYVLTSSIHGGLNSQHGISHKRRYPNFPYNHPITLTVKKAEKRYKNFSAKRGIYRFDSEDLVESAVYKLKESLRETCVTVEDNQYRAVAPVCKIPSTKLTKTLIVDISDYQANIIFNEKLTKLKMTLSVTTGDGHTYYFSRDSLPDDYPGLVGAQLALPDYAAKVTLRYLGLLAVEALGSTEIRSYLASGLGDDPASPNMTLGRK